MLLNIQNRTQGVIFKFVFIYLTGICLQCTMIIFIMERMHIHKIFLNSFPFLVFLDCLTEVIDGQIIDKHIDLQFVMISFVIWTSCMCTTVHTPHSSLFFPPLPPHSLRLLVSFPYAKSCDSEITMSWLEHNYIKSHCIYVVADSETYSRTLAEVP